MGSETLVWCHTGHGRRGVCLRLPREQALQPQTLTRVIPDWKRLLVFGTDGRRIRFNAQVTPEGVNNIEMRRAA